jgi:hypothetical protein
MSDRGIIVNDTVTLAVTNATGNIALGNSGDIVVLQNTSTKTCFVKLGGPTVTATTTDFPLQSGFCIAFDMSSYTYVAAICGGSDTTTLYASVCTGLLTVA